MTLRRRILMKIALAVVCLLLAALLTTLLYSALALQNPVNAVPTMQVQYGGAPLPAQHVMMSSYDWWFFYTTQSGVLGQPDDWMNLPAGLVEPGSPLEIELSRPANTVRVSRNHANERSFVDIGGELRAPPDPGVYTFRVEAEWSRMGSAQYYFRIEVVDPSTQA